MISRLAGAYTGMPLTAAETIARLTIESGDHDYIGPTETVPHPTVEGRTVRQAIPDPVHERFHGAVGDVIAGRVMPEARRQMQEALKAIPREKPALPINTTPSDSRRMGLA